jgi:hypothetical protein
MPEPALGIGRGEELTVVGFGTEDGDAHMLAPDRGTEEIGHRSTQMNTDQRKTEEISQIGRKEISFRSPGSARSVLLPV